MLFPKDQKSEIQDSKREFEPGVSYSTGSSGSHAWCNHIPLKLYNLILTYEVESFIYTSSTFQGKFRARAEREPWIQTVTKLHKLYKLYYIGLVDYDPERSP